MPEQDITKRLIEQLQPIMIALRSGIETDLSDRDKAAIIDALVEAAVAGARIAQAELIANAVEQGIRTARILQHPRTARTESLAGRGVTRGRSAFRWFRGRRAPMPHRRSACSKTGCRPPSPYGGGSDPSFYHSAHRRVGQLRRTARASARASDWACQEGKKGPPARLGAPRRRSPASATGADASAGRRGRSRTRGRSAAV
jgi:hypothetical protein